MSELALLSDLDGVLVDSTAAVLRAWRAWAAEHGIPFERLEPEMHGVPSRQTIARFAPNLDAAAESRALDGRQAHDTAGVVALPGARELLAGDHGSRIAIVTSGNRLLATSRLRAAGLAPPPIFVTADQIDNGKPHPEGYLLAAERLNVDPAACVVIEDAPAGIAAGKAAGMVVIAVTTTHDESELTEADALIPTLVELGDTLASTQYAVRRSVTEGRWQRGSADGSPRRHSA